MAFFENVKPAQPRTLVSEGFDMGTGYSNHPNEAEAARRRRAIYMARDFRAINVTPESLAEIERRVAAMG